MWPEVAKCKVLSDLCINYLTRAFVAHPSPRVRVDHTYQVNTVGDYYAVDSFPKLLARLLLN